MGTNFYVRKKLTDEDKQKARNLLEDFLEDKIEESELCESLRNLRKIFHVGKRSGGWQFLWQHNPEVYQDNLESIIKYLGSQENILYDEYGEVFDVWQFLNDEIEGFMYTGYNGESYLKDHPNERTMWKGHREWITEEGLRFTEGDFS